MKMYLSANNSHALVQVSKSDVSCEERENRGH